eukprot:SAG11_NODE_15151_length_587_cov_1.331967_2_plen_37_part_01
MAAQGEGRGGAWDEAAAAAGGAVGNLAAAVRARRLRE